jgi:hypothetical protein
MEEMLKEYGYTEEFSKFSKKNIVSFKKLLGKVAQKHFDNEEYKNLRKKINQKLIMGVFGVEIQKFNFDDVQCLSKNYLIFRE